MTNQEIFEHVKNTYESEHLNFDNIPECQKLNGRRALCAILKLQSLCKPSSWFTMTAAHDMLLFNHIDNFILDGGSVLYLIRCGVNCDSEEYLYIDL